VNPRFKFTKLIQHGNARRACAERRTKMKKVRKKIKTEFKTFVGLIFLYMCTCPALYPVEVEPTWFVDSRCFIKSGQPDVFDEIAVKDPTIVYTDGRYHMFYTGVTNIGHWQMGYASANTIEGFLNAEHIFMSKLSEGYFCAPQVFYFEPHEKWYLIYQGGRGATYATTTDIGDPESWDGPYSMEVEGGTGWDYFVICDDEYAYLFNTPDDSSHVIYMRKTRLDNFPTGWGSYSVVIEDTFEGVNVYRCLADGMYYLLVEDMKENRYYELWGATTLDGPWTQVAEKWASYHDLYYVEDHWTDNVSHGELIRAGVNQKLEIDDIDRVDFLIQGVSNGSWEKYWMIPWDLGLIHNYHDTLTPVPTLEPGDCTCDAECGRRTEITSPFTRDGYGEYCWESTCPGEYLNSWNLVLLEVNGVDYTNVFVSTSEIPPNNGKYYVYYVGDRYGHFEMGGECPGAVTPASTQDAGITPNPTQSNLPLLQRPPRVPWVT
jgi:hypothetical protein